MTDPATSASADAAPGLSRDSTNRKRTSLGAVFTRRWVADLVLDLAGYTADAPLAECIAIEPACGPGSFVSAMAERLVDSCRMHGTDIASATGAIVAIDIDPLAVTASRRLVCEALVNRGVDAVAAHDLAQAWVRQGDFLLVADTLPRARWVVGNPPYVRLEEVDPDAMQSYRRRWTTMTGRADLYVGFIEASLGLLADEGRLSFICADRWMRNQYGAKLRELVVQSYAVDACVVLHEVDAFEDRVAAYPAVVVLRAGEQRQALVHDAEEGFDEAAAGRLVEAWMHGPTSAPAAERFTWAPGWFHTTGSWPSGSPRQLALLSDLESRFPTLEEAGVKVSVGAATGADDVYVTASAASIEPDRLLKVLGGREVSSGRIKWNGRYLVNPWEPDGLVSLDDYPGMAKYLRSHERRIAERHVARSRPSQWWRTIDRIYPDGATTPKLLVPDLKDRLFPVLDVGEYYPMHSLCYLTSSVWDLEVLGGLLLSDLANLFVSAYSVRMANGYMRVSAQYLRRVRIPQSGEIPEHIKPELAAAFRARDVARASGAAAHAYGIELAARGGTGGSGV